MAVRQGTCCGNGQPWYLDVDLDVVNVALFGLIPLSVDKNIPFLVLPNRHRSRIFPVQFYSIIVSWS